VRFHSHPFVIMPARTRSRGRGRRVSSGSAASSPAQADKASPVHEQGADDKQHSMTPEEAMSESLLQVIFDAYDENGDGVLSLEELSEVCI